MSRSISAASHRASVEAWNKRHAAGTAVLALLPDGSKRRTVTTSAAFVFVDHCSCIHLEGISGAFPLNRVSSL